MRRGASLQLLVLEAAEVARRAEELEPLLKEFKGAHGVLGIHRG